MLAIEFFCCSGGMAEGFRRAGLTFAFAFDADPNACTSYEKNLGHKPIRMDVKDLLRMIGAGWRPGAALDLIVADPPCTPYSQAGKRLATSDARDMLPQTCEIIRALRPRAYLIGNVPGLDTADNWHVVQKYIGTELGSEGYCVLDYASLDAANFGVPQHRVRPFWYGHLHGPCIRWPEPTHGDPRYPGLPGVAQPTPWVTVKQALQHLPAKEIGRAIRIRKRNWHDRMTADKPAHVITGSRSGRERVYLESDRHPISQENQPSRTIKANGGRGNSSTVEWPWDRPSTTVTTEGRLPPPGHHPETGSILSQPNAVVLTEKSAAILQGFPDTWFFHGKTKEARWAQIGQAMPPALAEAVARAVIRQLRA